jgi:hypothetical protein
MGAIPDSIKDLVAQLQQFRSTHAVRTRLPEALWQKAVEAARQHGLYVVARALRLDYGSLQKRLDSAPVSGRVRRDDRADDDRPRSQKPGGVSKASSPAFVELARSVGVGGDEYVIEFESGAGLLMRVRWRGTTPEWSSLLRCWREVAG